MSEHNIFSPHFSRVKNSLISEINVTPLVDVMLVLLIIFMITSPMLVTGIDVDLPQANVNNQPNAQSEPLTITIDKQGKLYIMETIIEEKELIEKLKAITKEKLDTRIFIRGDKNIPYGNVMSIIDKINASGFNHVLLVTDTKKHAEE